jgi:cyanophycinase
MINLFKFIFLIILTIETGFGTEIPEIPSPETIKSHASCIANIEECKEVLKITSSDFPVYISRGSNKIEKVIVVIHGTDRNANEYLKDLISNIDSDSLLHNTAVVAPHFLQANDPVQTNEIRWDQGWIHSWKYGFKSAAPVEISSFEVIDRLIKNIDENWHPKKIMIVGHSAGAQFVQRYAHGTRITYDINSGISYVVSNPSSYLYSLDKRLINDKWDLPVDCKEYNTYIYGLEDRNEYLSKMSVDAIRDNYVDNHVIYLMGEADTLSDDLDESCEANIQGKNRIERARNYFAFLNQFFPDHHHRFITVPKVGHDHIKMFSSGQFIELLAGKNKYGVDDYLTIDRDGKNDIKNRKPESLYFLNGGGTNIDEAFVEFLKSLNGGDLLILSGKDEPLDYNEYFIDLAKENSVELNSVTTILIHSRLGGSDPRLLKNITQSEGIFFSGGDQWKYIERIKQTPANTAINEKIKSGIPFGGTSAGLAILGDLIFTAQNGSVSSDEVMSDPKNEKITLEKSMFDIPLLNNILTDTHFVVRDRMGRLVSFLGRGWSDTQNLVNGLGVDEETVLIFNKLGDAHVMGKGSIYLLRPTDKPAIDEAFNWKKIQVNRWSYGSSFSLTNLNSPDYFYDVQNGELFSTQPNGEIY